jgi:uncharacterized membrane-anchored protein
MFDVANREPAAAFPPTDPTPVWRLSTGREALLVAALVGLQLVILVAMIVLDGLPLILGERVRLQVVPVDPRDLFRGDYVVLRYDFTRLEPGRVAGLSPAPGPWSSHYTSDVGRDVYISLEEKGGHHEVAGMSVNPPASGTYLRGRVTQPWRIECGIEAYYVQEGEGLRLEEAIRQRSLQAEVAVWRGQAKLVRLIE